MDNLILTFYNGQLLTFYITFQYNMAIMDNFLHSTMELSIVECKKLSIVAILYWNVM